MTGCRSRSTSKLQNEPELPQNQCLSYPVQLNSINHGTGTQQHVKLQLPMVKLQETHHTARHLAQKHYSNIQLHSCMQSIVSTVLGAPPALPTNAPKPVGALPQEASLSHGHDHVSLKRRNAIHTCAAHERHGCCPLCALGGLVRKGEWQCTQRELIKGKEREVSS